MSLKGSFILIKRYLPILNFLLAIYLILVFCFSLWTEFAANPSKFFPVIEGWKKSENILVYPPENLFDYINGAADLYLSYDFQKLQVCEYLNDNGASVLIEIYHHKTPMHAFGIYSQERPIEGDYLNIGAQGYYEGTILNFTLGKYYVKMNCYDAGLKTQQFLQIFAKKVEENLEGKATLPKILNIFPNKEKKKNSEKFIAVNFLGYSFLHFAFTADYEHSGEPFKLFIIEGVDSSDCKEMITQYLQKTKSFRKEVKEGQYTISDPYHGKVALFWKGKYIWGALNLSEESSQSGYIALIEKNLRRDGLI